MKILLDKSYKIIREIFLKHMILKQATRVLDIGCGRKGNFCHIPQEIYTGIDKNERIIRTQQKRADGKYYVADARTLEVDEASTDYVISVSFFHHVGDDEVKKMSKLLKKILKKNGKAIIADGVYPNEKSNVLGKMIRFFDLGRHVRNSSDFKKLFLEDFSVEKEYYFTDKIFAYSVLVMSSK